jgi:predicted secreted protein
MSFTSIIAIYFVLWWVVLLAVLPWGVHSQQESGEVIPGTDPGAPSAPSIWRKLVWTTIISAVVLGIFATIYNLNLIPYDFLMRIAGPASH